MSKTGTTSGRRGRPRGQPVDGVFLHKRRKALGLSREQLAERAGINMRTIARAERVGAGSGHRLSNDSIERLADALNLAAHDLVRAPEQAIQRRLEQYFLAAPSAPEHFVGRQAEAERIIAGLTGDEPRPVCITGPRGIGKTALARHIVHRSRHGPHGRSTARFPHGVVWVKASHQGKGADAHEIQTRVAAALSFAHRLPPREQVPDESYAEAFAAELWAHERLLVLDDLLAPELIDHMTPRAMRVPILATTHLVHVAERFGEDAVLLTGIDVSDTRAVLAHHLGEDRIRADEDGVVQLHDALAGNPRGVYISGKILQRERLVKLGDYARRVHRDPGAGQYPTPLRDASNSLLVSFSQTRDHVSPAARSLLGALSLFEDVPFSLDWAVLAGALSSEDQARSLLSELMDVYLIVADSSRESGLGSSSTPRFRLESHVPLFARSILGERRAAMLEHLARHAVGQLADIHGLTRSGQSQAWQRIAAENELWGHIVDRLANSVFDDEELRAWDGTPPFPGRILLGFAASCLVDLVVGLLGYLEQEPTRQAIHQVARWMRAAVACAHALERYSDEARLLLFLGRFQLSAHVDLETPIAWFDRATGLFEATGAPVLACAAASEAGRALFGCQRAREGLARFEHAVTLAYAAFDHGPELACRLNGAAVSFSRSPVPTGWQRAERLLEDAVAACTSDDFDTRFFRFVCTCNLASVRLVLATAMASDSDDQSRHQTLVTARADLERGLAEWRHLDIEAPMLEARLLLVRTAFAQATGSDPDSEGREDRETARLRARATALWREQARELTATSQDFLWQLGEAAFYLRLYLHHRANPEQGLSPVIANATCVSDIAREIRPRTRSLVPVGFISPVAALDDIFDSAYRTEVRQLAEDVYGPENRIAAELDIIETLR